MENQEACGILGSSMIRKSAVIVFEHGASDYKMALLNDSYLYNRSTKWKFSPAAMIKEWKKIK